jgi:hypothetical protein
MTNNPIWSNPDLILYHGTDKTSALNIIGNKVDISNARANTDFGKGFYTTTNLNQAKVWANIRSQKTNGQTAIVKFTVDRSKLAKLDFLCFVRYKDEDFWKLIEHCRLDELQNRIPKPYDVVFGPVVRGKPNSKKVWIGYDQVSFHTKEAISLLINKEILD